MTLDELEATPGFEQLSYRDQLQMRSLWMAKNLDPNDPDLKNLDPAGKKLFYDMMLYRAPVLSDKNMQKGLQQISQTFTFDTDVRRKAIAQTAMLTLADQSLILKGSAKLLQLMGQQDPWNLAYSKDAAKMREYLGSLLSNDRRTAVASGVANVVAGMVGMGVDMALMYGTLAGTITKPKFLAKAAQAAIDSRAASIVMKTPEAIQSVMKLSEGVRRTIIMAKSPRFASWLVKSAAPSVTHAILGGGLVGAIREPLMRILDETQKAPTFPEMAMKMAEGFGGYALGDLMFWALGGPIKSMAKATGKIFKKTELPYYLLGTNITMPEFEKLLMATASGGAVDDTMLAQLPAQVRKRVLYARDLFKLTSSISELGPASDEMTRMLAATRGWMAEKEAVSGKWTLEPFMGEGQFVEFENTTKLRSWMAPQLVTPEFTASPQTVLTREMAQKAAVGTATGRTIDVEAVLVDPGYYARPTKKLNKALYDSLNPDQQAIARWMGALIPNTHQRMSFLIPGSLSGASPAAGPLMTARAIYERFLIDTGIPVAERAKVTFGDIYDMVLKMQEDGFLMRRGTFVNRVVAPEAWWTWIPDGEMLNQMRGYLAPEAINGLWDSGSRLTQPIAAGKRLARGKVVDTAEQVVEEVAKGERIPVSGRALITPQEAQELLAYGVGKRMRAGYLTNADLEEIMAGRMPSRHPEDMWMELSNQVTNDRTALVLVQNPMKQTDFDKLLKQKPVVHFGEWMTAREEAIARGFDSVIDESTGNITAFWPDQVKYISDAVDPYAVPAKFFTTFSDTAEQAAVGSALNKYKVSLIVKGQIKTDADNLSTAIASLLTPRNGRVTKERIAQAYRYYLKGNGIDPTNLKITEVPMASIESRKAGHLAWNLALPGTDTITVGLPNEKLLGDPEEVVNFINTTLHEFQHGVQQFSTIPSIQRVLQSRTAMEINAEDTARAQVKQLMEKSFWTPSWANMAVGKQSPGGVVQKVAGGWSVARPGTQTIVYNRFEDVIRDVLLFDLSDFQTIHNVVREKGLILYDKVQPDGSHLYQVTKKIGARPKVLTEDTDLRRLLDRIGFTVEPSSFLMPELIVVDGKANGLEFVKNVAVGDYQSSLRNLGGYRAKAKAFEKVKVLKLDNATGTSLTFDTATAWYRVEIPEAQIVKDFATVEEAKAWMEGGWRTTEELKAQALQKGYALRISDGGWHLWNKSNSYWAKDMNELKKLFGTIKVPASAPEMLGDYRVAEQFGKPPDGTFKPEWFDPSQKGEGPHPLLQISHWARPADAYFVSWVKNGASPDGLKIFRSMETARRAAAGDMYATNKALWTLFTDPDNPSKLMKKERRQAIFYYMDAPSEFGGKQKVVDQYSLTAEEIHRADLLKKFFDQLFVKFGVPSEMFLPNYISHLRKLPPEELAKLSRQTMAEILRRSGAPRQFDEFFKHWRIEDVPNFVMDDDALAVALKYSAVGHRALYLNPTLDDLTDFLRNGKKNGVPVSYLKRMEEYRDSIVGLHGANEEAIHRALIDFGERVGVKNPQGLRQLYNAWYSTGYLAMMGWRPYSAVRNLFQIWTTLAPRFGNTVTSRGLDYFLKNSEYIYETLKTRGIIMETLPVFGGEMLDVLGRFSNITHKGLAWFKNADDITRGIAWSTAKIQWDDALKNYDQLIKKGVDPTAAAMTFLEHSGVGLIEPDIGKQVTEFVMQGKWQAGFDTFAANVVNTTMFAYQAGLAPSSFKGLVGKMFGMFGVYPAWYVEGVRRGLRYGTPAQKAAFAGRFVGNSLALFGAFAAVGINAKDFLPWVPAQFTGGPYYKLANKLLLSIGNDYAARQARGELKKEIPRTLIPGSMAFSNLMKAIDAADNGDFHEVWLHLTSAPHSEE